MESNEHGFFPLMRSESFCEVDRKGRRDRFSSLWELDSEPGSLFLLEPRFLLPSILVQQLSWMKRQKILDTTSRVVSSSEVTLKWVQRQWPGSPPSHAVQTPPPPPRWGPTGLGGAFSWENVRVFWAR